MEHKDIVLQHHERIWNHGEVDAVEELYAEDFVGHHPGAPDWVGRESVKLAVRTMRAAFPDLLETVEDIVVDGDRVVSRFRTSGTHLGPLQGLTPTGRRMTIDELAIFRLAGSRIVEKWGLLDRLGMYQQLGIVPPSWPPMEFLYDITMDVEVQDVGLTPSGHRRIVMVTGGAFSGPALRGRVLPGGGDWLLGRADGSRRLDVRIALETDDGALIYASYGGVFGAAPDTMQRIVDGDDVDPATYYFRTAPFFETAAPQYHWLNGVVAIGYGRRRAGQVGYSVYTIR